MIWDFPSALTLLLTLIFLGTTSRPSPYRKITAAEIDGASNAKFWNFELRNLL
ncbi:MAG: hypothetical protein RL220_915, partial [Bacteroidota bacterium]